MNNNLINSICYHMFYFNEHLDKVNNKIHEMKIGVQQLLIEATG